MPEQDRTSSARGPAGRASGSPARPGGGELSAQVEALSSLNDASSRLWHVSNLEEGLQEILHSAISLLAGDMGNVQLLGDDGLLRIAAHDGFKQPFLDFFRTVGAEDSVACGRALRTGQRVIVEDVELDEDWAPVLGIVREAGYRAVQSTPIVNRDGRPLGMISTHFRSPHRPSEHDLRVLDLYVRQAADFMDRYRGEERLRQSEQSLKALSDIAPGTILFTLAQDGIACSFMSGGWRDYTGEATEAALGAGWLELMHADDRERVRSAVVEATARREPFFVDHRLRRADGEYRWVLAAGRPRYGESGEFSGFFGSVIDVHERKVAQDALREREAILAGQKEAFQAAMDGRPLAACLNVLARTAVTHYGDDTRAAFYMLRDGDPESGLHHITGMSEDFARDVDGFKVGPESLACGLAMHTGEPAITPDIEADPRCESLRALARTHGIRASWSFPVQTRGGPTLGTFGLYFGQPRAATHDDLSLVAALAHAAAIIISKYFEAAERARAEQALKDTNRRKDEFLAVLGHELRNPLAPLSTAADLLQLADKRPDLIATVRPMMRRQIDHLSRLVDDLLDVSRISRGHAELQLAPLDVRRAIENAIEQSAPLIAARRHRLIVELGDDPLRVDGDFQRLTQVFVNLISNAAKYSELGAEITVRASREDGRALVRVTDRGFGIPKERMHELFEMFSQVPEHRTLMGAGGLGIGLALSRQLVEMHGGSIAAHSEGLGRGSEFSVRLPLAAAVADDPDQARAAQAPVNLLRRRVLIVDDNVDAATVLRMALEQQGHDVHAVFGGAAALEAMAEFEPEVVLLDLGMPAMDGFEVARRIRALPNGGGVLIVALTGWGQEHDRERTQDAGFDRHLTKPVSAGQIVSLLALDDRAGAPARRVDGGSTGSAPSSMKGSRRVS